MPTRRTFLDTNVFLYAFLNQDTAKKSVAARIISNAVLSGDGYVSSQVVNEFCNVMLKKSGKALSEIHEATKLFARFRMVEEVYMAAAWVSIHNFNNCPRCTA